MNKKRRDLLRGMHALRVSSDGEETGYSTPELDPRLQSLLDRDIATIARSAPSRTPEQLLARMEARRTAPSPARPPTRRARSGRVVWTGVALACAAFGVIVGGVMGYTVIKQVVFATPAAGFIIVEVSVRLVRAAARHEASLKSSPTLKRTHQWGAVSSLVDVAARLATLIVRR